MTMRRADTVYLDGRYMRCAEARISPDDRGFLFADGVYEVVRVYGGRLFEIGAHLDRLRRSLREIRIPSAAADGIDGICSGLIERCGLSQADATVYVQITRGAAPRGHAFPADGTPPTVYVSAAAVDEPPDACALGIGAILVPDTRWARCDIKSTALLPNVLARQMAVDRGAREALFIRDGVITEGTASTFCAVSSGSLLTHPLGERILPGITRTVVLRLCRELGIPAVERPVTVDSLSSIEEAMILSTTREIMPVTQIDGAAVGHGLRGPVTRRLQEAFAALTESARRG
ncbi:MAG: aminotransferase class IV [Candidatus Krumholzibacteria bacterium]|nr:aminotransferase class IV [Candidatus Krumholzibacteria bacterium]